MKRKLLSIFTVLCCLQMLLSVSIAEDIAEEDILISGDFAYILREDGSAELFEYIGDSEGEEIFIPNELDGHPVMAVAVNPFWQDAIHVAWYTVSVREDHPYLEVVDGVLFGKTDRMLICYPPLLYASEYSIPEGTERICTGAFDFCTSLTTVIIPDSVSEIGDIAFYDCRSLSMLSIPDSVIRIGSLAFGNCFSLTEVSIPNSVTFIADDAFIDCSSLTVTAFEGSYAEAWCKEHGIKCTVIQNHGEHDI
jgi:hypothetical protein